MSYPPELGGFGVSSWITRLTRLDRARSVLHPHQFGYGERIARGVRGNPATKPTAGRETGAEAARRTTSPGAALVAAVTPDLGMQALNHHRDPLPTGVDGLPHLPSAYHAALDAALAALATVGLRLEPPGRLVMDGHLRLLAAWNGAVNLTAIVDPVGLAQRHVADSLAAVPVILEGPHDTLIDIGSGAGFPGIPIAATLPAMHLTLVESIGKKAAFLRAVAGQPGLAGRVDVRAERAEAIAPGDWDVVTARAVGALADLVELGLPLLRPGGRLLAWKRGDLAVELAAADRAARAMGGSPPRWRPHPKSAQGAADLAGHGVVVVEKRSPTPEGYPRDPAGRKRRPW